MLLHTALFSYTMSKLANITNIVWEHVANSTNSLGTCSQNLLLAVVSFSGSHTPSIHCFAYTLQVMKVGVHESLGMRLGLYKDSTNFKCFS